MLKNIPSLTFLFTDESKKPDYFLSIPIVAENNTSTIQENPSNSHLTENLLTRLYRFRFHHYKV